MSLRNNKNWHYFRALKSLLVIIVLQLVILQVKALSMPVSMNHESCSEIVKTHNNHSQKSDSVSTTEQLTESCSHCEDSNLDCHNSCHTASLFTLVFEIAPDSMDMSNFLYPVSNETFIATSLQPSFKPPRLLIV
jgi:hypothetical protein